MNDTLTSWTGGQECKSLCETDHVTTEKVIAQLPGIYRGRVFFQLPTTPLQVAKRLSNCQSVRNYDSSPRDDHHTIRCFLRSTKETRHPGRVYTRYQRMSRTFDYLLVLWGVMLDNHDLVAWLASYRCSKMHAYGESIRPHQSRCC